MTRRYISQLGHQETIDDVFLASGKQLRPNRNGNLYLQVQLCDKSGTINAMLWNANEKVYRGFENGDYVHVEGTTQVYQGGLQVIATHVSKAQSADVADEDFMPVSPHQIDQMAARLGELLRGVGNPHLRALAEAFLMDEDFMRRMSRAPAGIKNHHAYLGGLLEHVVNLMEIIVRIKDRYPQLDGDLLLFGAFVHDLGKIDELSYDRGFGYTDHGQLVGHVVMGISILERKVREAQQLAGEPIPPGLVRQLEHMIVSHHGSYEFGSPKLPMTREAIALHHLDNLDAKVHSFDQLMRDDPNVDSPWTTYHANLSRKLYKGQ